MLFFSIYYMNFLEKIVFIFIKLIVLYIFYIFYIIALNGNIFGQFFFLLAFIMYYFFQENNLENIVFNVSYEYNSQKEEILSNMLNIFLNFILILLIINNNLLILFFYFIIDYLIFNILNDSFTDIILLHKKKEKIES